MEPTRNTHATLVDLLDRILDKGLVINADVIISVAGIPLIGVNLRAALAGMETMLKYGVMQAWDEKSRVWEREHYKKALPSLIEGEEIALKMYGSYHYSKGIYNAWRQGYIYLTNKKLLLHRQDFNEIVFQIPLEEIKALIMKEQEHFVKDMKKQVLYLIDKKDQVHQLSAVETDQLKQAIKQRIKDMGFYLEENPVIPELEDEQIAKLLMEDEEVIHRGKKVWYLVPAEGIQQETWRPGHLYLTNKRLCWWYDFEKKIVFDVPVNRIIGFNTEMRKTDTLGKNKENVLDIIYRVDSEKRASSFSGNHIDKWEKVLGQLLSKGEEAETCPQCGKESPVKELLENGCTHCGWVSPRLKRETEKIMA